ncbi:ABC transporter permease [Staphylococcus warneri]|uniref:ABC transporter permease n=2 Tax=Staphylococcus warneri TaxID=1292 RepID=UPI00326147F2
MKMNRLTALFEKELKETWRNPSVYLMPLLIIGLTLLYHFMLNEMETNKEQKIFFIVLIINFSFIMCNTVITLQSIAEENDKKTLIGLIQTPTTMLEILLSKALLGILLSVIISVISLILLGQSFSIDWSGVISLLLLLIFYTCLGILAGLLSNTIGQSQFYNFIIIFLFGMAQMKMFLDTNEIIDKILSFIPSNLVFTLLLENETNNLIYLSIWVIIIIILTILTYRKRSRLR